MITMERPMPFFAVVNPQTNDVLEVVMSLDHEPPPGCIVIELPGPGDDVRAWLAAHARERGGGGNDEAFADRDPHDEGKQRGHRAELRDSELFYARLEQSILRAETEGRHLAVILFSIAPSDHERADVYASEALRAAGQDLLPCDVLASLRPHLVGVLLPDVDARELRITAPRGAIRQLTYPGDHDEIEALRRRRHPWLRNPGTSLSRAS
jgi:hypothetical protein